MEAAALLGPLEKDKAGEPGFDFLYGTALIGDGNTVSGTAVINRILSRGDSAEARLLRGTLELSAHERDSARADLEKAIALNPRLSGAHARLGELLLSLGESDQARAVFAQELALDPEEFTSNLNMGVLAKQDQDYAEALRYFDRALKTRPNDPGIRYQIANVDLATGNLDQARKAHGSFDCRIARFRGGARYSGDRLLSAASQRRRRSRTRHLPKAHGSAGYPLHGRQTAMRWWLAAAAFCVAGGAVVGGRGRRRTRTAAAAFYRYRFQIQFRLPHG